MAKASSKRPAHRPEHEPTPKDRLTVKVMVAGGIEQIHIAAVIGIRPSTLRKHYRAEIGTGAAEINAVVVAEHIKRIRAGDFKAIQWWEQARMNWSETQKIEASGPRGGPIPVVNVTIARG
jgi:hypothetical protein